MKSRIVGDVRQITLVCSLILIAECGRVVASPLSPTDFFSSASASDVTASYATGQIANTVTTIIDPNSTLYTTNGVTVNHTGGTFVASGSASASANRATGQLRAEAGAIALAGYLGATAGYGGNASASFGDTLYFTNSNAGPTTHTTVGFSVHVDGTSSPYNGQPPYGPQGANLYILVGDVCCTSLGDWHPIATNIYNPSQGVILNNWTSPITVNETIAGQFTFVGSSATVPIFMILGVRGQYGFTDFSNTATFSFAAMPDGVSYTSESGDFLRSTPLPAALPLFATGLAGLGLLGWCRKRKTAAAAA